MSNTATTNSVHTISELIQSLTNEDESDYSKIMRSIEIPFEEFEQVANWSVDTYVRNCLFESVEFELILLCWESGQGTPIHGHDGEKCWVFVADGDFKETIYVQDENGILKSSKISKYQAGDLTFMHGEKRFHKLENISDARSLTLHLYAKPIRKCKVYNQEDSQFITRPLKYDNIVALS